MSMPEGTYRTLRCEVTQEMLDNARKRDSSHCMNAEAVKAAHPDVSLVSVDLATIRFTDQKLGKRYTYLTPPVAQAGLVAWDQGEPVAPYEFTLRQAVQVRAATPRAKNPAGKPGPKPLPDAPSVGKPSDQGTPAVENGPSGAPTLVGGRPLPKKNVALATGKGKIRRFGLRQLRP